MANLALRSLAQYVSLHDLPEAQHPITSAPTSIHRFPLPTRPASALPPFTSAYRVSTPGFGFSMPGFGQTIRHFGFSIPAFAKTIRRLGRFIRGLGHCWAGLFFVPSCLPESYAPHRAPPALRILTFAKTIDETALFCTICATCRVAVKKYFCAKWGNVGNYLYFCRL